MKLEQFVEKVNDKSISIKEVFDHLLTRPDVVGEANKSTFNLIRGLRDNIDFDLDKNFFESYNKKEFSEALAIPTNRFKEMSRFETIFKKALVTTDIKAKDVDKISGKNNLADNFGYGGVQFRGKDPMRGTVLTRDLDTIYQTALENKDVDYDTKAFSIYEKYTGQRIESVINKKTGLMLSDLTPGVNPDTNQIYVDVKGKSSATKQRPSVRYTDEFAEFLIDVLEKAKTKAGPDADFTKITLFNTTKKKVDEFWNGNIRPALEEKFEAQLPLDNDTGRGKAPPKVLRKILARQLVDEFRVPTDLVKSWMGHAGAGVSASGDILEENYTGVVPDDRIGYISNNLLRNDGYNVKKGTTVNTLFASRGIDVDAFSLDKNKAYATLTKPYRYTENSVTSANQPTITKLSRSDRKLLDEINLKQAQIEKSKRLDIELKNLNRDIELNKKRIAATKGRAKSRLMRIQEKLEEDRLLKLEKAKIAEANVIKTAEDFDDDFKTKLGKMGIKVGAAATAVATTVTKASPLLTPVAGAMEFQQSKKEGKSNIEAGIRAGAEVVNPLPVGVRDIEQVIDTGVEKASEEASDKGKSFLDALSGSLTGIPMGLAGGYSSGGFITKKQSRR